MDKNIVWRKEEDRRKKGKRRGRRQDGREEEMEKRIMRGKDKATSTDGTRLINSNKQTRHNVII